MARSVTNRLDLGEVNRVDLEVNKVDRLVEATESMRMAKAKMGAAVEHAIGDRPLKEFGDKGQMSNITSGEKVPEYLARIYHDPAARRRFALALLDGDTGVRKRIVLDFDAEEVA